MDTRYVSSMAEAQIEAEFLKREADHCHYENRVGYQTSSRPNRVLNRIEIDF
jgi:hypothetical protein